MNNAYYLRNEFSTSVRGEKVRNYIGRVFENSIDYYKNNYYYRGMDVDIFDQEIGCLKHSMQYLEDYLYYYDKFYSSDFDNIFDNLSSKLERIAVLPRDNRKIYGEFKEEEKAIYINPGLLDGENLTGEERTRLYICHELGHIINSVWMKDALYRANNFSDLIKKINDLGELEVMVSNYNGFNFFEKQRQLEEIQKLRDQVVELMQLRYDGFSLIDEVTTQNRAEAITYYFVGKIRPEFSEYRNFLIFCGDVYHKNFDFYGEMEDSAICFAKSLRGIGSASNDLEVMKLLSIRTLDARFVDKVFYEYENDGYLDELYSILENMGMIKNASYALFGAGDIKYLGESKKARDELFEYATPLQDSRSPYSY